MSVTVMLHAMLVILLTVLVGFVCQKTGQINDRESAFLSKLFINVFNPAIIFSSVLSNSEEGSRKGVLIAFAVAAGYYIFIILLSILVGRLFSKERTDRMVYKMCLVFSNLGLIGIPVVSSVFGKSALIYVAVFILEYNMIYYVYRVIVFRKEGEKLKIKNLKGVINPGTVSCFITLAVFFLQPAIPEIISETAQSVGNVATPVALIVIGVSVGCQKRIWKIFVNIKQYFLAFLQLLFLPVVGAVIMKHMGVPAMLAEVSTIMLGMPTGSLPLIQAKEWHVGEEIASGSVILTTILSMITLPFVVWVYQYL